MGVLPNRREAVVLVSGGLDSATALWWALNHYTRVRAVCLDYGQRHGQEIKAAQRLGKLTGTPLQMARLHPGWTPGTGGPEPFLRGHNAMMIGVAAGAIGRDTADIVIGTLSTDPYADCSPEWRAGISAGLDDPWGGHVRVLAPLAALKDKVGVVRLALSMGVPIHLTWSCREPVRAAPCGQCRSCRSRDQAITDALSSSGAPGAATWAWQRRGGSPDHARLGPLPADLRSLVGELRAVRDLPQRGVWSYLGPDGSVRFTPWIANPDRRAGVRGRKLSAFRIAGFDQDRGPWEVLLLDGGATAVTAVAPGPGSFETAALAAALVV